MPFIPSNFTPLPKKSDVIIIGSGIMGCAAAYYLAKKGIKALVLEQGQIASKQSSKAWGFVRQQGREGPEIPLMQQAVKLWEGLENDLGLDLQWKQAGCLYIADDKTQIGGFENWADMAKTRYRLDTRVLTAREVSKLVPGWNLPTAGGLYTPNDGQAEPKLVAAAFASKASELGAIFVEGCSVLSIEKNGTEVTGVITENGFIQASTIVCASGTNTYRLLKTIGIDLPQQIVRASCVRTNAQPTVTDITICGGGIGFRQKNDGTINLGDGIKVDVDITLGHLRALEWYLPNLWSHRNTFDFHLSSRSLNDVCQRLLQRVGKLNTTAQRDETFNHLVTKRTKEQLLHKLEKVFPLLEGARIVDSWSEQIDVLPDGIPVIEGLHNPEGLIIATGFCGHGFALGPLIGKLVADLIDTGKTDLDLSEFRLSRYESKNIRKPMSLV